MPRTCPNCVNTGIQCLRKSISCISPFICRPFQIILELLVVQIYSSTLLFFKDPFFSSVKRGHCSLELFVSRFNLRVFGEERLVMVVHYIPSDPSDYEVELSYTTLTFSFYTSRNTV